MAVDYTPSFDPADVDSDYGSTGGDITVPTFTANMKPFRFWCQRALPLVYDDSLSYYEVLCKVVDQLNGFLTDLQTATGSIEEFAEQFVVNQQFLNDMADQLGQNVEDLETYINNRMDDFTAAYQQLQSYVNNYFDNLDVQQEINNKLDEMAQDGTLNTLFDPVLQTWMTQKTAQIDADLANQNQTLATQNSRISVLEGRMDTFASLPSGSTSGNAELLDIRTNFLGETFGNAGDAVRASDLLSSGFVSLPLSLPSWQGMGDQYYTFNVERYKGGHIAIILNAGIRGYMPSASGESLMFGSTEIPTAYSDMTYIHISDLINANETVTIDYTDTTTYTDPVRELVTFEIPTDFPYNFITVEPAVSSDISDAIAPDIIVYGTNWIETPIDTTLTQPGEAAEAKATGDGIARLNTFKNDTFDYITQILDETQKISGKYYYKNSETTGDNASLCVFPPVSLTAGKTYTLVNVRPVFCNYKANGQITTIDNDDVGGVNKTVTFTPNSDGQLFITGGNTATVMLFNADYSQSDYVYGDTNYKIKNAVIGNQITENNCTFFKKCVQYLESASAVNGYWNIGSTNKIDWSSNENVKRYPKIKLEAGVTYKFINVYGYFCIITDEDDNAISRLTNSTAVGITLDYTPEEDQFIYVSVGIGYFGTAMVCNDPDHLPEGYTEGLYYTYLDVSTGSTGIDIHVKTDGSGDYTSVVDAVNYANGDAGDYPINIYVHTGDYDILQELGGQTFINTIENSPNERQGLVLLRNNVNIIGVGYAVLRFEMPDTVTYTQASRVSCLNLREFSNSVENLTLISKNCRYVIHDETNGGNPYIHRKMKNLRCIHKGNVSGLWEYPTVLGGGAGGGSTYDIINCQFITSAYHQAFSYHTNYDEEASFFNVDGCVGSVRSDAPTKISFRFSYHGTGRTGICVANVKNCSGNGQTIVVAESIGDTGNNIEMYVNGWETIGEIPVTGNE